MSVFSLPKPTNTTNTDTLLTLRVFLEAHKNYNCFMFMSSVPTRLLYRNIIIENAILMLIILSNNVYATQGNAICLQISNYSLGFTNSFNFYLFHFSSVKTV